MALTKATLIDLNSNELILDLDADTSITADTDDTIHFKIAGSDELVMTGTAFTPAVADGSALGSTSLEWSDIFLADGGVINFGSDQDVTLTHVADSGLALKSVATSDDKPVTLVLQTGETDIAANDVLGVLNFQAPDEGTGPDAILVAAGIAAVSEGDFSSSNNATKLSFRTAESAAASETMSLTSNGDLFLAGGLIDLKNDGNAVSQIKFYCESSNAHAQTLIGAPHSEGATNVLTLPGTGGDARLVSTTSTATLTNKTLTTPVIAEIDSGSTITLDATTDIILDADGGDVFFKDGGTTIATFTNSSSDFIVESGVSDKDIIFKVNDGGSSTEVARFDGDVSSFKMASGKKIMLGAAEETISGDGTDITFEVGSSGDINIPANIGLTFGDDGEKIEGDGTDLTISGNNINLTATAAVNIPAGVGLTFATAEKIESDGTDLTVTVGSGGDINVGADIGITFGDDGEKIEGDGTDLTIASSAKINLTATSDVHIPNNVGIVFGGDSEKIEGDGTDLTISANNLTVDDAADINLDAGGADVNFKDDGTTILSFTNSSSDAVITAGVQDKDIIFKGDDGGSAVTSLTLYMSNSGAAAFSAAAYNAEATLTDASTISWNAITQPVAKVTLGANRTLGAASGGIAGAFISLLIIQDGTGSRTVTFNAAYEFKDDTAPTLTSTAAKGDLFVFRYNGSKWLEVGRNTGLTLS